MIVNSGQCIAPRDSADDRVEYLRKKVQKDREAIVRKKSILKWRRRIVIASAASGLVIFLALILQRPNEVCCLRLQPQVAQASSGAKNIHVRIVAKRGVELHVNTMHDSSPETYPVEPGTGSAYQALFPNLPLNAAEGLAIVWLKRSDGTFSSVNDIDFQRSQLWIDDGPRTPLRISDWQPCSNKESRR